MYRSKLLWLIALIACIFGVCTLASDNMMAALLLGCTVSPCLLALAFRVAMQCSHVVSAGTAMLAAISVGSMLLAYGSYYHTFVKLHQGYLIGGGWSSVIVSAGLGSVVGAISGLIAIVMYATFAAAFPDPAETKQTEAISCG